MVFSWSPVLSDSVNWMLTVSSTSSGISMILTKWFCQLSTINRALKPAVPVSASTGVILKSAFACSNPDRSVPLFQVITCSPSRSDLLRPLLPDRVVLSRLLNCIGGGGLFPLSGPAWNPDPKAVCEPLFLSSLSKRVARLQVCPLSGENSYTKSRLSSSGSVELNLISISWCISWSSSLMVTAGSLLLSRWNSIWSTVPESSSKGTTLNRIPSGASIPSVSSAESQRSEPL